MDANRTNASRDCAVEGTDPAAEALSVTKNPCPSSSALNGLVGSAAATEGSLPHSGDSSSGSKSMPPEEGQRIESSDFATVESPPSAKTASPDDSAGGGSSADDRAEASPCRENVDLSASVSAGGRASAIATTPLPSSSESGGQKVHPLPSLPRGQPPTTKTGSALAPGPDGSGGPGGGSTGSGGANSGVRKSSGGGAPAVRTGGTVPGTGQHPPSTATTALSPNLETSSSANSGETVNQESPSSPPTTGSPPLSRAGLSVPVARRGSGVRPASNSRSPAGPAGVAPSSKSSPSQSNTNDQGLHILQSTWCLWLLHDRQSVDVAWKDKMQEAHTFNTVEGFWRMHHNIHGPSCLGVGDYYLFRRGIAPDWNDPVFQHGGGRLVIQMPSRYKQLDTVWLHVSLIMIGEMCDASDELSVCGAVAACRAKLTKIAIWIATSSPRRVIDIAERFFKFTQQIVQNSASWPSGADSKFDMKPEFESFRKGNRLETALNLHTEKAVISWSDLQKVAVSEVDATASPQCVDVS